MWTVILVNVLRSILEAYLNRILVLTVAIFLLVLWNQKAEVRMRE